MSTVTTRVDQLEPTGSLARLLEWRARERPDFPLLWVEDAGPWTVGDLAAAAEGVHRDLVGAGLRPGDRVLVRIGNDERFLPAVAGAWAASVVPVVMHPAAPAAEVRRVLGSMDVAAVVAAPDDAAVAGVEHPVVDVVPVPQGAASTPSSFTAPVATADDDPALVLLTSGSTGRPKGVVITHGNAWANVRATVSAFRSDTRPTPLPARPKPPNIIANPLSHTGGAVRLLFGLYVGRPVLLLRKFTAPVVARALAEHGIDNLTINPAMIRILLEELPEGADLGSVRYVSSGTAPLPPALRERFEARFGVPVLQAYGQTEAFGAVTIESAKDVLSGRRRPGSVGRPLPGVELRIVTDDGTESAPGEAGEVWVRTASSTRGYLGDDASPVDGDGWLHTGDIGHRDDDGYLYITGRKRSVIICGGFNIVPEELEAALMADDAVRDAAVVPLPDDRLGEIPVALVEAHEDDPDGIMARVRERVSPYKRPRQIFVIDALPRVPVGKVDRAAAQRQAVDLCDGRSAPPPAQQQTAPAPGAT